MKILKKVALYSISFAGAVWPLVLGISLGLHYDENQSKAETEMSAILKEQGYEDFNAQYKIEQINSLSDSLNSGELTYDEYFSAVENLSDYDQEQFIAENASSEVQAQYSAAQESYNKNSHSALALGLGFVGSIFTVPVGVGSIYALHETFAELESENQQNKEKVLQ